MIRVLAGLLLLIVSSTLASAGDWPMFRGPGGNGIAQEPETPSKWDDKTNVKWRTPLSAGANGSPIVSKGKVFIESTEDKDGKERSLICFDADTGKELWKKVVDFGKKLPTHQTNPYAPSTPASDGKHVAVWHGSAGLYVYDHDGREIWHKNLGEFKHIWGYGTSPIIVGENVILSTGPGASPFIAAYNITNGNELWKHVETADAQPYEQNEKRYKGAWATPVLWNDTLVCSMTTRVIGLDVSSGKLKWFCAGTSGKNGELSYSSPIIDDSLCFVAAGYQGAAYVVDLKVKPAGEQKWLWRNEKNPQNIGTGFIKEGFLYRVNAGPNSVDCLNIKDGTQKWQDRGTGGAFWGSISYNGKYAYATDQKGTTLVFEPSSEKLKIIAQNKLHEDSNSTLALSDGKIFIRTYKGLWCIGK